MLMHQTFQLMVPCSIWTPSLVSIKMLWTTGGSPSSSEPPRAGRPVLHRDLRSSPWLFPPSGPAS